jgi:hypothetical protein
VRGSGDVSIIRRGEKFYNRFRDEDGALVAKRCGRWQPQNAESLAMHELASFRSTTPAPE